MVIFKVEGVDPVKPQSHADFIFRKVSRRPLSIAKIVLQAVFQFPRNDHARYHRYRVQKRDAPPKLPPSQRPLLPIGDAP